MQGLKIKGGNKLKGCVEIKGAKNSILVLLAACVLTKGEVIFHSCPELSDVYASVRILNSLGCRCTFENGTISARCSMPRCSEIPDNLMRQMRGSVMFLGSLLGRTGKCTMTLPGGCEIGLRPIDMHINALEQMGVTLHRENSRLDFECRESLHGANIILDFPSVGATENVILAAALAKGETVLHNAAREPEIADLAKFINLCGGRVKGAGSDTVVIEGVKELHGCEFTVMPDRIEAATFMGACGCAGGEIVIKNTDAASMEAVISVFRKTGMHVYSRNDEIFVSVKKPLRAVKNIRTMPYPGFPTDVQPVIMGALTCSEGTSVIVETIFENRWRHVPELARMGADIRTEGRAAFIRGVKKCSGANVKAPDLRGGAALVNVALGAEGTTLVSDIAYIDRGYESIEKSLGALGADIKRINI